MQLRAPSFTYPFSFIAGNGLGFLYSSYTQIPALWPSRLMGRGKIECLTNATNGNLVLIDKRITFPEISGKLEFFYIYNSLTKTWSFSAAKKFIAMEEGSQIILCEEDGHTVTYKFNAKDRRYYAPGHSDGIPYFTFDETENCWTSYHPKSRVKEVYNLKGFLTKRIDSRGNETIFNWTEKDELNNIQTSGCNYNFIRSLNTIELQLEKKGYSTTVHTYLFEGDQLIKSIAGNSADHSETGIFADDNYVINYAYNRIGQLQSITQTDSTLFSFEYYNDDIDKNKLKNIYAGTKENFYNFSYMDLQCTLKNSINASVQLLLDTMGRLMSFVEETRFDSSIFDITSYEYSNSQLSKITFPNKTSHTYLYEEIFGLLIEHSDPAALTTKYIYEINSFGQPLLTSTIKIGNNKEEKTATTVPTYYIYEENFKKDYSILSYEISPLGSVKKYTPDQKTGLVIEECHYVESYVVKEKSPTLSDMLKWSDKQTTNMQRITYKRDLYGQILKEQKIFNVESKTSTLDQEIRSAYDDFGNTITHAIKYSEVKEGKPDYLTSEFAYNYCEELLSENIGDETTASQLTTHQYTGSKKISTLPNKQTRESKYNEAGLIISLTSTVKDEKTETRKHALSYDTNGRIEKITLPDQQNIYEIYDRKNCLTYTISPLGAITEFQYNSEKRFDAKIQYYKAVKLESVLSNGKIDLKKLQNEITKIKNELKDRQTYTFYNKSGDIQYKLDAGFYLTETRYDELNRPQHTIQYATKISKTELSTLKEGKTLELKPSRKQDRISSVFHDLEGNTKVTQDAAGYVTEFEYDAFQNPVKKTVYFNPNLIFTNEYKEVLPIKNAKEDSTTYYFYNTLNQCILEVDAEGYITTHAYYLDGKEKQTTRFVTPITSAWYLNPKEPPVPVASIKDQTTEYKYDQLRRIAEVISPVKAIKTLQYDKMNQLVVTQLLDAYHPDSIEGDDIRRTEIHFDGWEQIKAIAPPRISQKLLKTKSLDEDEKEVATKMIWANQSERKVYTESGLHIKTIDSIGNTSVIYYDLEKRPCFYIDATGYVFQKNYNTFGECIIETHYYKNLEEKLTGGYFDNAFLEKIAIIANPNRDAVTVYERDSRGQIIQTIDPEGNTSKYKYSAFKDCIEEALPVDDETRSLTLNHEFDPRGLKTKTTKIATDVVAIHRRYYANPFGKETRIIDEVDALTDIKHDRLGRVLTITKSVEDYIFIVDETNVYDAFHRKLKKTNAAKESLIFEHDDQARTLTTIFPIEGMQIVHKQNIFDETIETVDGLGSKEIFKHAPDGQISEHCDALGETHEFIQDDIGQTTTIYDPKKTATSYYFNGSRQLTRRIEDASGLSYATDYEPNFLGNNENIVNPRGILTLQTFDRLGRLKKSIKDAELELKSKKLVKTEDFDYLFSKVAYNYEFPFGKEDTLLEEKAVRLGGKKGLSQPLLKSGMGQVQPTLKLSLQLQKSFTYNAQSKITWTFEGDTGNPSQFEIQKNYDGFNRLTSTIIDPKGLELISTFNYDAAGSCIKSSDANGFTNRTYYDFLKQKRYEINMLDADNVIAKEWQYTPTGKTKLFRHSAIKLETNKISDETHLADLPKLFIPTPQDAIEYFFYDKNDQLRFHLRAFTHRKTQAKQAIIHEYTYDLAGREQSKYQFAKTLNIESISEWNTPALEVEVQAIRTPELDRALYKWYNARNELRFEIDQDGHVTEKNYDKNGNCIYTTQYSKPLTNPEELIELNEYALAARIERDEELDRTYYKVFDTLNREIFSINPRGAVTAYSYDENNNKIATCEYKKPIEIPKAYDQLVAMIVTLKPDPLLDSMTKTEYDDADRAVVVTDSLGYKEIYEFDASNNIKTITNRNLQVTHLYYDKAKRQTLEVLPETSVACPARDDKGILSYTIAKKSLHKEKVYDGVGNILQIILGDHEDEKRIVTSTYNALKQPITSTYPSVTLDDESLGFDTSWLSLKTLPEKVSDLTAKIIYDTRGNIIAERDLNNAWEYKIYDELNRCVTKIDRENAVIDFTYDSFDRVTEEYRYANKIENLLLTELKPSKDDRVLTFEYDRNGNITKQKLPPVFFYSSEQYGFAQPTTTKKYDAFNQCIYEAKLVRPEVWAEQWNWYDSAGNLTAIVDADLYLTRYQYNMQNKMTHLSEYATRLTYAPDTTTSTKDLDQRVSSSPDDRHYRYEYDLLNQKIKEIRLQVTTQAIGFNEQKIPMLISLPKRDLEKEWAYSPTQKLISLKHEDGQKEFYYYDNCDHKIGQSSVPRTTFDEKNNKISLLPMTLFRLNIYGETIATQTSPKGGVVKDQEPALILESLEDLIENISYYDTRGLLRYKQNENHYLTGYTFTPNRQVARELQATSRWIKHEKTREFSREDTVDEKQFFYNKTKQPYRMRYLKNGIYEEGTYSQFNAFKDLIGEGDKSTEYPAVSDFDTQGLRWRTNVEKGATTISLYDLAGFETMRLQAPQDDLQKISYDNLSELLKWDSLRLERTETLRDVLGHPLAQRSPLWFKNRDPLPTHTYTHDRWHNVTSNTDAEGHCTDYYFNHLDQMIKKVDPEVDVWDEKMQLSRQRLETIYGYQVRGFEIGMRDPNFNTTAFLIDEAGNNVGKILPDGTRDENHILDALGRTVTLSHIVPEYGEVSTNYSYDGTNNIKAQRSPSGLTTLYAYDIDNNRIAHTDPAGSTWRYNYDSRKNISARYMPLGQRTQMYYDRNHKKIAEFNPDESKLLWEADFFGNLLKYSDISNKISFYEYDYKKQMIHRWSETISESMVRYNLHFDPNESKPDSVYYTSEIYTPPADEVKNTYSYGLIDKIEDYSINKLSIYLYNKNQKPINLTNCKLDGTWINTIKTTFDELNRESYTEESRADINQATSYVLSQLRYDAASNYRNKTIILDPIAYGPTCPSPRQVTDLYHTYDSADRVLRTIATRNSGASTKTIHDVTYIYEAGFRTMEDLPISEEKKRGYGQRSPILYDNDSRLSSLASANSELCMTWEYNTAGWVSNYYEGPAIVYIKHIYQFNENLWLISDDCHDVQKNRISIISYLNFTEMGQHKLQITDLKDGTRDTYQIEYKGFDRWLQSRVSGTRINRDNGKLLDSPPPAQFWYDPHGLINAKTATTQDEPTYQKLEYQCPILFETTPQGLILSKQYLTKTSSDSKIDNLQIFHYLHNTEGALRGSYSLLYSSNEAKVINQNSLKNHASLPVTLYKPYSVTNDLVRYTSKSQYLDPSWLEMTDPVPIAPQTYIVESGDTFSSIAQKYFGDYRHANKIAMHNGFISIDSPKPGLLLYMPQIIQALNKSDIGPSRPYHLFVDCIMGNLLPILKTPKPKRKHTNFWATLVKAVAIAIIIMVAPEVGIYVAQAAFAGSALAAAIVTGVSAAIMDAELQGLAIGLGMQSQFSFTEMLETGISAGTAGNLSKPDTFAALAKTALRVGTVQVSTQLVEMAVGLRDKFDARQVVLQISATLVNLQMSEQLQAGGVISRNVASTATSSILGKAIYNTPFDINTMSTQLISGTVTDSVAPTLKEKLETKHLKETPTEVAPSTSDSTINPDLAKAEQAVEFKIPDTKLDFSGIDAEQIRKSRPERWQSESTKRRTWEHKQKESSAQKILAQLERDQASVSIQELKKGFISSLKNSDPLTELLKGNLVKAAGSAVLKDYETLTHGTKLSERFKAGTDLALDAFTVVGFAENAALKLQRTLALSRAFSVELTGVESLAVRQRVLANIADSQAARNKSYFKIHALVEKALNLDVSTELDAATFWSGKGNRLLAENYASNGGRMTLEMTAGGKHLDSLELFKSYSYEQAIRPWEVLSKRFAQSASGRVSAFVENASPRGIFNRIEYPTLRANSKVTEIVLSPELTYVNRLGKP